MEREKEGEEERGESREEKVEWSVLIVFSSTCKSVFFISITHTEGPILHFPGVDVTLVVRATG